MASDIEIAQQARLERVTGIAERLGIPEEQEVTVRAAAFRSKSRNTPFDGWKLRGRPAGTILGGRRIVLPER